MEEGEGRDQLFDVFRYKKEIILVSAEPSLIELATQFGVTVMKPDEYLKKYYPNSLHLYPTYHSLCDLPSSLPPTFPPWSCLNQSNSCVSDINSQLVREYIDYEGWFEFAQACENWGSKINFCEPAAEFAYRAGQKSISILRRILHCPY